MTDRDGAVFSRAGIRDEKTLGDAMSAVEFDVEGPEFARVVWVDRFRRF